MSWRDNIGDGQLEAKFRSPVLFGPAPGPRNLPRDKQRFRYANHRVAISVSALTDEKLLSSYLPDRCRLTAEPVVNVTVTCLTQLGWLAGRGYNIVTVRFPNVAFAGRDGEVVAGLCAVMWESLADPIVTGRDEVAMPKIYAEIPNPVVLGNDFACSASWQGFGFFELAVTDALDSPPPSAGWEKARQLNHRFMPRTGALGEADAEYMTVSAPDPNEPKSKVLRYQVGSGRFAFKPARWEDMPTQYPIVNALAGLPLSSFRDATVLTCSQGEVETVGGGTHHGLHRID